MVVKLLGVKLNVGAVVFVCTATVPVPVHPLVLSVMLTV